MLRLLSKVSQMVSQIEATVSHRMGAAGAWRDGAGRNAVERGGVSGAAKEPVEGLRSDLLLSLEQVRVGVHRERC